MRRRATIVTYECSRRACTLHHVCPQLPYIRCSKPSNQREKPQLLPSHNHTPSIKRKAKSSPVFDKFKVHRLITMLIPSRHPDLHSVLHRHASTREHDVHYRGVEVFRPREGTGFLCGLFEGENQACGHYGDEDCVGAVDFFLWGVWLVGDRFFPSRRTVKPRHLLCWKKMVILLHREFQGERKKSQQIFIQLTIRREEEGKKRRIRAIWVTHRRKEQKTFHKEVRSENHQEIQRRVSYDPIEDRRDPGAPEVCRRATHPSDDQERQEICEVSIRLGFVFRRWESDGLETIFYFIF